MFFICLHYTFEIIFYVGHAIVLLVYSQALVDYIQSPFQLPIHLCIFLQGMYL